MKAYMPHVLTFLLAFALIFGYGEFCTWQANHPEAVAASEPVRSDGMSWLVADAGDANANGVYTLAGTYNEVSYYTNATGWELYLAVDELGSDPNYPRWALGTRGETEEYQGAAAEADLPANPWGVGSGTPGAPTLSAYTPGDAFTAPLGVLIDEDPASWWDLTITVADLHNISETEAQTVSCAWYTQSEPYTLIATETFSFTAGSSGTATFNFGRHPEVHGYFFVWGDAFIRCELVAGTFFDMLNPGSVYPTWPVVATIGSVPNGPTITTGAAATPGAGDRLSGYSVLLDVGAVEFASGIGVMQHVEAEFATAYTTAIRPGVYAPASYGVFCPVSAEAATAYSTRGERVEKQVLASYGVMQNMALAEFPTAYTVEGTIGGGPGMLLMALMKD